MKIKNPLINRQGDKWAFNFSFLFKIPYPFFYRDMFTSELAYDSEKHVVSRCVYKGKHQFMFRLFSSNPYSRFFYWVWVPIDGHYTKYTLEETLEDGVEVYTHAQKLPLSEYVHGYKIHPCGTSEYFHEYRGVQQFACQS